MALAAFLSSGLSPACPYSPFAATAASCQRRGWRGLSARPVCTASCGAQQGSTKGGGVNRQMSCQQPCSPPVLVAAHLDGRVEVGPPSSHGRLDGLQQHTQRTQRRLVNGVQPVTRVVAKPSAVQNLDLLEDGGLATLAATQQHELPGRGCLRRRTAAHASTALTPARGIQRKLAQRQDAQAAGWRLLAGPGAWPGRHEPTRLRGIAPLLHKSGLGTARARHSPELERLCHPEAAQRTAPPFLFLRWWSPVRRGAGRTRSDNVRVTSAAALREGPGGGGGARRRRRRVSLHLRFVCGGGRRCWWWWWRQRSSFSSCFTSL